ncbi:hypothetical protein [Streptomyces thermoalcalitolerans]|uniref:Uncharacterized protein n=1 Tax=Streptomyces thermoalcalitolerans TaxID=65605 RepID=A0ABP3YUV0_9ACTN
MWRFRYDEDGFVVAESDSYGETVCRAVSDFFDDVRSLHSTERLLAEWDEIKRNYPQDPTGVAFNATSAELTGDGR